MRLPARPVLLAAILVAATAGLGPRVSRSMDECRTGADAEGPFYVAGAPFRGRIAAPDASGIVLHLSGRVLASDCTTPVASAVIDVWQADVDGCYSAVGQRTCPGAPGDVFHLRGRVRADAAGRYSLQTVKPGLYGSGLNARAPHIHVKVFVGDRDVLTTQLYFAGERQNARDSLASEPGAAARTIAPQPRGDALHGVFDFVVDVDPVRRN